MKYFIPFLVLILFILFSLTVYAMQETCPKDNGWTKIDSNDLSLYPVQAATEYCFKAGSDKSKGCNGGLFSSWPQPEGTCGLSHWSYYIPSTSPSPSTLPSPSITSTSSANVTSTPTTTPTITPTVTPTSTPEEKHAEETPYPVTKFCAQFTKGGICLQYL